MRKLTALGLALALFLSGCAAMLERDYLVTGEHMENPPGQSENVYRVETYSGLTAALRSYVEEGMDTGVLRFPTTYAGNLTVDMEKGKRQLLEEEPIGCYALSDLTYHISRIISYYEVTLTFDYRVEREKVAALRQVRGQEELQALLRETLAGFLPGFTARISLSALDEESLRAQIEAAYLSLPQAALGRPEVELTFYPEHKNPAVVEAAFTYPESVFTLRRVSGRLTERAKELTEGAEADPAALLAILHQSAVLDEESGGATAAHALLEGAPYGGSGADREGFALAYQLLCDAAGVPCVLSGENGTYLATVTRTDTGETVSFDPADAGSLAPAAVTQSQSAPGAREEPSETPAPEEPEGAQEEGEGA